MTAVQRLVSILFWTLYFLLLKQLQTLRLPLPERNRHTLALFQRWSCRICQILQLEIRLEGNLPPGAFLAPNHQSYLDIFALSSLTPVTFIAKAEIGSWPVVGALLRTARQILLQRVRNRSLLACLAEIGQRFEQKETVCAFLEGTTFYLAGKDVGRFHASLLQPVIDQGVSAVPVGIVWSATDPEIDIGEDVAYWKDHQITAHAWRLLGLSGIRAEVRTGKPLATLNRERSELAQDLEHSVRSLLRGDDPKAGRN